MNKERIEWIDWLKGICIILIVLGHIIRGFISAGMFNEIDLNYIDYTIYSFHMPLMFLLSGILYGQKREKNLKNWKNFILDKTIKLYIPYLIFSYIMFIFKFIFSGSINSKVSMKEILLIPFKPFDIYWFLLALLIIFIIYSFMDYKKISKKIIIIIGIVSLIISFYMGKHIPNLYYINKLFYYVGLGFYFYLGTYIMNKNMTSKLLMPTMFGYIILNIINYFFQLQSIVVEILLAISMIIVLVIIAQNRKRYSQHIKKLGEKSMVIYLLHTFFTAFSRIFLTKINIFNFIIQISVGLIIGIIMPLLLYYTINKIKILNWCNFLFYPRIKVKSNE